MPRLAPPTREPRQAEAAYIRDLTRVWGVAQAIVAYGLEPLLAVWPEPPEDSDAEEPLFSDADGDNPATSRGIHTDAQDFLDELYRHVVGSTQARGRETVCEALGLAGGPEGGNPKQDAVSPHFHTDRRPTQVPYNPLLPQPRRRPVRDMTDAELRRLWPSIPPADIRRHAPWATSRDEVVRVAFPGQGIPAGHDEIEAFVRQSVAASRASPFTTIDEPTVPASPPGPGAFQLRPRYQVPVILTAAGSVVPPPPRPVVVSSSTITRQLDWLELALGETVTTSNLETIVEANGQRANRWNMRETSRVLGIDPRQDPGVALQLRQWNLLNTNLIESGVRGAWDGVRLRPLLSDVAHVVEQAHMQGVRVEVLASDLVERFGVSDSRAQLIARDQTLTLNGQLNRSRQQAAGIAEYVWVTSRDERVREEHQVLDGRTFSWAVGSPEGHPGEPPN
jgi:SPP1 gp7 family putative phage head morphogenesis protein